MIIKCPACGQNVSDKAIRCNKCGEPINNDVANKAVSRFSLPKSTLVIMTVVMLMGLFFSYREIKTNTELENYVTHKMEMFEHMNESRRIMLENLMESIGF